MRAVIVLAVVLLAAGVRAAPAATPSSPVTARATRRPPQPASSWRQNWSWTEFVGDSAITLGFVVLLIVSALTRSLPGVWSHAPASKRKKHAPPRRRLT